MDGPSPLFEGDGDEAAVASPGKAFPADESGSPGAGNGFELVDTGLEQVGFHVVHVPPVTEPAEGFTEPVVYDMEFREVLCQVFSFEVREP